jgi:DNA-binding NarL/FixJ family response regulator
MYRMHLTPRERSVASLVAQGMTNAQIADDLGVSVSTTKQNITNILIKWNCNNRTHIAVEALRRGVTADDADPAPADTGLPRAVAG